MLEHPSIKLITCWKQLLTGCNTLSTFTSRIETAAKAITDLKDANKLKGDVFEVFCELLIRLSPIDDRIGIADYHPYHPDTLPEWIVHKPDGDVGVDGWGHTLDGLPATVQCKYRKWNWELGMDENLHNFVVSSLDDFGIPPTATGRMLILTTGQGLNWYLAKEQFMGKVRCISRKESFGCLKGIKEETNQFSLSNIVDNKRVFWDRFCQEVSL
jgi:hypothetical protein